MASLPQYHRASVVACARQWIGTPYHHQASCIGAGVDCIGLVRGVWRALHGSEPETLPGYGRDWSEATGRETLLEVARRHFIEVATEAARAGDVLVFRYRPRAVAKHVGILSAIPAAGNKIGARAAAASLGDLTARFAFIHAMEGTPVTEAAFTGWWHRRLVAAFRFPGVLD